MQPSSTLAEELAGERDSYRLPEVHEIKRFSNIPEYPYLRKYLAKIALAAETRGYSVNQQLAADCISHGNPKRPMTNARRLQSTPRTSGRDFPEPATTKLPPAP
jgi:hypothetical protein